MDIKKILPYFITLAIFVIASLLYFNPVLSGKQIKQGDITQFTGMAKEIVDYRKANNNEEPYWIGNAFSGMPSYQVSTYFPNDFMMYVDKALRFLPRPADYLFLYFFGFFILLTALKVDWKLAVLGALSFGFSTYLIIIFGAGHNAKAHAIAYMPLVTAGVLYVFQKRYILGFFLTAFAVALEIYTNHPQITYYLGFCLLILGILEFIESVKNKTLSTFAKQATIIIFAAVIGVGVNAPRLLSMKEYADYSNRGKSALTINPDGSKKEVLSGLDRGYITEYSYGKLETFNLFVPRFMGGGTVEELGESSNFYKFIEKQAGKKVAKDYSKQVLTYWGDQPILEAPAYIGAIVFLLFFLGVFLVKGRLKYWLVLATIFSILMSWGKNFGFLTDLFIDFVPLYNKFRAVSSIQVIAEFCVPLLGILGLREFFSAKNSSEEKKEALKKSLLYLGGLIIVGFLLAHMSSTFEGLRDGSYSEAPGLIDALIADRKSMLLTDSLRSLLLIGLSSGLLWFFLQDKIKKLPVIITLTVLVLFDLVSVDLRYVNKDDFTTARRVQKPFTATEADKQILEDKSYYRVANFTTDFLSDGRTSYFHKSIGGYHAAKMKRYQELFEYQFNGRKQNPNILNMLNAKYFIVGADQAQLNPDANGNAWFVENVRVVNTQDEELQMLDSIDAKKEAIYSKANAINTKGKFSAEKDTTATIGLTEYAPNKLVYKSNSQKPQFAVFSEIYYKNGWNAYVDDKLMPHYQVNYVLRGMEVPAGEHTIEFKFEPTVIKNGKTISIISYALLLLVPVGWFFMSKKKENE